MEQESGQELAKAQSHVSDSDLAEASQHASPESKALYEAVVAALKTVFDPEIPVNIYDLGLIYRVDIIDRRHVEIDMTLTAPGCPVAGEMLNMAKKAVDDIESVGNVKVNLVFDPPWDRAMMSEEAKLELGFVDY
ncbi:SUF system Fe-S cluster assembly protein [Methylocystis sp. 9N]|uniref:SUF system Fe-S cluster assembly protein n=1 Tax=Methylocystis borbori TaxID=3118750 RepID=A0ABU7XKS3_9HYPH